MAPEKDFELLSVLGFAMKAGKVRSGAFASEKAIRSGGAFCAVLDEDASDNTKKHWSDMCINAGVPLISVGGVGQAIGRESHMVACIIDKGFAEAILSKAMKLQSNSGV